jgi:hypothetical protein
MRGLRYIGPILKLPRTPHVGFGIGAAEVDDITVDEEVGVEVVLGVGVGVLDDSTMDDEVGVSLGLEVGESEEERALA